MDLSAAQLRILGCLVEKETTTPDNYPLSTNALLGACNQRTNREPVVDYDERTVDTEIMELRHMGLARTVTGGRANKHKHVLAEAWALGPGQLALLAVLMLRGPQTVGELRTRTERMHPFDDLDQIEGVLADLAGGPEPMVEYLERRPGQKERRWRHLLGDAHEAEESAGVSVDRQVTTTRAPIEGASRPSSTTDDLDGLRAEVARLRRDVDRLYGLLGEEPPAGDS